MRVAVLGGGLQGACVAMELASAGISVDLYDKNDRCLTQASAQNEGKIHLGYVYANDPTLGTARAMVRGAITFAPLMRRWLGADFESIPVSSPFNYVVHADSLLSTEQVAQHFLKSHAIALAEAKGNEVDYFGSDYRVAPVRMSDKETESVFDRRLVAAAFKTSEIAIDPESMAQVVRSRLSADANIRCLLKSHVHGVDPDERGATIDFETAEGRSRVHYDHVVNALWDGRLAVDRKAGLEPERPWLYRVKHYLRIRAPGIAATMPSATIVLGAFGDLVSYGDDELYLSWYPAGMRGSSSELSPPAWPLTLDGEASTEMRLAILDGLVGIVPAVAKLTQDTVASCETKAGIIFAWGSTDIHDRASGLHERHAIGPRSHGRYHTIDTGKLTVAPLFGKLIADRIRQIG